MNTALRPPEKSLFVSVCLLFLFRFRNIQFRHPLPLAVREFFPWVSHAAAHLSVIAFLEACLHGFTHINHQISDSSLLVARLQEALQCSVRDFLTGNKITIKELHIIWWTGPCISLVTTCPNTSNRVAFKKKIDKQGTIAFGAKVVSPGGVLPNPVRQLELIMGASVLKISFFKYLHICASSKSVIALLSIRLKIDDQKVWNSMSLGSQAEN